MKYSEFNAQLCKINNDLQSGYCCDVLLHNCLYSYCDRLMLNLSNKQAVFIYCDQNVK